MTGPAETDRKTLVALYNTTDGENWRKRQLAERRSPRANGRAVTTTRRAFRAGPRQNALSGEIPAELGSLSKLEWLALSANELSGCVPSSLEDQVGL